MKDYVTAVPIGSEPRPGPRELDDLSLERASRGERAACAHFVAFYQRPVFALLARILGPQGDPSMVEDLAQETFLRALRALPRFRQDGPARLSTWLLTIATRQALSELRRPRHRLFAPHPLRADASSTNDPRTELHLRQELVAAIAELTPEQRAVFALRDYHGLTDQETALALDIPVTAVKARLYRARARLRKTLRPGGEP